MRIITTILLLICFNANATVYYVSNSGSNAANGLTTGTAWQTLSKINGFTFSANDSILLKSGDSWNEQLLPPRSNLYFGQYGTGANPIITGLQSATGWTDSVGNIRMASIPNSVAYQNTIVINGKIAAKGRYPNYSYLGGYVQAFDRVTLNSTIPFNCTGAELVLSNYVWIWDVNKIASQSGNASGDTIRLQTPLTYNANWVITPRLFIQNSFACLDTLNEWYFDSTRKKLFIVSASTPSDVKFSSIDTVVSCHNKSYLTFQNISFQGGNRINFSADSGSYVTVKNCQINFSGMNGIGLNKSPKTTIQNTSINNSLNNGIYMRQTSDSTLMDTDTIKNSGVMVGMNLSGNAAKEAVFAYGNVIKFQNSIIDSVGYIGYAWIAGLKDTVYRNIITNYCLNSADGGGIYTDGSNTALPQTGSLIRSNIVSNGVGAFGFGAAGIYLDNQSSGVTVDSNTVSHNTAQSLVFNGGVNIIARNNLLTNNLGACFKVANALSFTGTIKNNILYSTTRLFTVNYLGVINASVFEDSNYVLRSNGADSLFQDGNNIFYGLSAWRSFSGKDLNTSNSFPAGIASQAGTVVSNQSLTTSVIPLSGQWVDVYGNTYTGGITLNPFQSSLLFYSSTQHLPTVSSSFKIGSLNFQ